MVKLGTEKRIFQFDHATVIYTCEHSKATNQTMPMLEVQAHDQYGYQREWSLGLVHSYDPNTQKTSVSWESHIYMHPGRREICKVGETQAKACIDRFIELCETYPDLLFNPGKMIEGITPYYRPRHEGFVRFAEMLHRGATPSKTML